MIFWIHFSATVAALLATGCRPLTVAPEAAPVPDLQLVAAYPVEAQQPLEPSGLTVRQGTLFTVADKVDDVLYRISLEDGIARLVPHLQFDPPEHGAMDWEGLTSDPGGSFYIISERRGRLLRVTADGTASWASADLRPRGRDLGLFSKRNAGFEGVTWLGPNHWLAVVEREPRGLLEWTGKGEPESVDASSHRDSPFISALSLLRLPDYSGLSNDNGTIYALFRNAHLVVRLEKADGVWTETAAWSYKHIENDPALAYRAQAYGQAEGLVVDGSDVFLIFDNNLGPKLSDPRDRRPLLVHARFP